MESNGEVKEKPIVPCIPALFGEPHAGHEYLTFLDYYADCPGLENE